MPPRGEKTNRRSVLDLLLGAGVVGWMASVFFPVLRYLKPLGAQTQNGPVKLAADDLAKLQKDRSVIVRAGASRIIVLEDANQQLHALFPVTRAAETRITIPLRHLIPKSKRKVFPANSL